MVSVLFLPFDLIKAGATQTETSLLRQYVAGERVDLLDDYDFPARTITERSTNIIVPLNSFVPRPDSVRIVTFSGSPLRTKRGVEVHLPCVATGHPRPNITWTKGSGNSIFDIEVDGFKYGWSAGSLIILNPSIADSGRYTCTAENQYSDDTRSLNVIVQGEFVLSSCPFQILTIAKLRET